MKYFILSILIILNIQLYSQPTFIYNHSTQSDDYVLDVLEDENGNYYLAGYRGNPESDYYKGLLIKIGQDGSFISEREFTIPNKAYMIYNITQDSTGSLIMIGTYSDTINQYTSGELSLRRLNYDLTTLDSALYYISDTRSLSLIFSDICTNNDILINSTSWNATTNPHALLFGMRLNENFDSIFAVTYPFPSVGNGIKQLTDTTYWMYGGIFNRVVITDTLFNQLEISKLPKSVVAPIGLKWDSDSSFYFCGQWLNNQDHDIGLLKQFDPIDTTEYIFKNWGTIDTIDLPASLGGALDYVNKDSIYIGGTTGYAMTWGYKSYYFLIQTDSLLNVRWERFYGGDAYYEMNDVLASKDGGCLLSGMRYDADAGIHEHDIYVIKVDGNGLLVGVEDELNHIDPYEAIVYPNPGISEISIRIAAQYKESKFELFDFGGNLVISKNILSNNHVINTYNLKAGSYIYSITNNKGLNETGVWIKQ